MSDEFDRMEREEAERNAVDKELVGLARKFVESEEINCSAAKAQAALRGTAQSTLEEVVVALEPTLETFDLRPLGIRGFDQEKLRNNLAGFLRLALTPAARLRVAELAGAARGASASVPEVAKETTPDVAPSEPQAGAAPEEATDVGRYVPDQEELETLAEADTARGIFPGEPALAPAVRELLRDALPAPGDLEGACSRIETLLARAEEEFTAIERWHGARVLRDDADGFRAALLAARTCLESVTAPDPGADFVAADVHQGVTAALRLVGAGNLAGTKGAADSLTTIILLIAGLISSALSKDETARQEYSRTLRKRAEARAAGRAPSKPRPV